MAPTLPDEPPGWDFEGSAAAEDEEGVARCYDVAIRSVATDRTPEEGRAYAQQMGTEVVSSFVGAHPIESPCRDAFPDAEPFGVCTHDALLQTVQQRTVRHYYRAEASLEFEDPPRVRCEREGGVWVEGSMRP